jgi:hypothetical protein
MNNYFTLPALFGDLFQLKINACGTVRHDRRGMPWDIGPKSLKKKRNTVTWVRGTLRAVCLKDRRDVYILTNMHAPCVEGKVTLESGQAIKPRVVEDNDAYMGFVDQETVFSPDRHDHSKRISYTQVVWRQNDAQKFCELIIHSQEENVTASGISSGRPSPTAVPRVFAAQANTGHAVFLQKVWRWSVCSALLWEVACAFELRN